MRLRALSLLVAGLLGVHTDASTATSRAALGVLELRQYHGGGNGKAPIVVSGVVVEPTGLAAVPTTVVDVTLAVTLTPPIFTVTSTAVVSTGISMSSSSRIPSFPTSTTISTDYTTAIASTFSTSMATSTSSIMPFVITDYTTVKWYESWVGGTYSTWYPTTIEVHPESMSPAPQPGKGEIGMGTLTGELGVTQTIYAGAAASQAPRWVEGVAAAVGFGVVGVLV